VLHQILSCAMRVQTTTTRRNYDTLRAELTVTFEIECISPGSSATFSCPLALRWCPRPSLEPAEPPVGCPVAMGANALASFRRQSRCLGAAVRLPMHHSAAMTVEPVARSSTPKHHDAACSSPSHPPPGLSRHRGAIGTPMNRWSAAASRTLPSYGRAGTGTAGQSRSKSTCSLRPHST
jgi:hypothetical protein